MLSDSMSTPSSAGNKVEYRILFALSEQISDSRGMPHIQALSNPRIARSALCAQKQGDLSLPFSPLGINLDVALPFITLLKRVGCGVKKGVVPTEKRGRSVGFRVFLLATPPEARHRGSPLAINLNSEVGGQRTEASR